MHIDLTAVLQTLIPVLSALAVLVVKEIRSHQKDNTHAATVCKLLDTMQAITPVAKIGLGVAEVLDPKLRATVEKVMPVAAPIMQAVMAADKAAPGGIVAPAQAVVATDASPSNNAIVG